MKWYLFLSITGSITVSAIVTSVTIRTSNATTWPFIFFVSSYFSIFFVAISGTAYAWRKLSKPGISGEIRSTILKRHIVAIILYLVFNFYVFASAFSAVIMKNNDTDGTAWKFFLKFLFYSQGYVMPLMRCTEPAFFILIKRRIK